MILFLSMDWVLHYWRSHKAKALSWQQCCQAILGWKRGCGCGKPHQMRSKFVKEMVNSYWDFLLCTSYNWMIYLMKAMFCHETWCFILEQSNLISPILFRFFISFFSAFSLIENEGILSSHQFQGFPLGCFQHIIIVGLSPSTRDKQ